MGTSDGQIDDARSHCRLPLHLPCLRPPASLGPRQLAETSQSLHVVNVAHNNNRDFGGLYAVVTWESGERHFARVDSALRLRRSPGGGDLVASLGVRVAQLVGGSAAALESGRVVKTPGTRLPVEGRINRYVQSRVQISATRRPRPGQFRPLDPSDLVLVHREYKTTGTQRLHGDGDRVRVGVTG